MKEKIYTATIYFNPIKIEVFNCETLEEAEESANELAIDLARCCGNDICVNLVEVEPNPDEGVK